MTPPARPELTYPPHHHVLRDLPFELEDTGPDAATAHVRVTPEVATASGRLDCGPVLVVVDVLAGLLVGRVIAPDWMATAQLALHLTDPPAAGDVTVDAVVRRAGRTTIVVEATVADVTSRRAVGDALLTFVRLPRRDGNLDIGDTPVAYGRRVSMGMPGTGLTRSFREEIGVRVVDAGAGSVVLDVDDYVRNSFGAVNGGVVAAVAGEAALALAGAVLDGPAVVLDVVATYLAQAKVGPLRTRSRALRDAAGTVLVRVEVLDGEDRVLVVAHVHCGRADGGPTGRSSVGTSATGT